MSKDENAGGSNQPEERAERTRNPEHGDADDEETGVEVFLGDGVFTKLCCVRSCVEHTEG